MWNIAQLAAELNKLVDEGKGECQVDMRVVQRYDTGVRTEFFFDITAVLDEAIEVGTVSICGKDVEPWKSPSTSNEWIEWIP